MSMRHWSFHQEETGEILDHHFSSTDDGQLLANTPLGSKCIEGHYDHLSQRVDLATGRVVDYQPPQPSTDHEWNATAKRWQLTAAVVAKAAVKNAALQRIAQLEVSQHRFARKALLGEKDALVRLLEIDTEISALEKDLA